MRNFLKYSPCIALMVFSAQGLAAETLEKKAAPVKSAQMAPISAVQTVLANISVASDDESLMNESPLTLDVGDSIEIKRYDAATKSYQVIVVDDPTPEPIFATPESVTKAIHSINPDSLKADPSDIVGSRYSTDEGLVILFDFELDQRKSKKSGS